MNYYIGVDLGTSSVKLLLMNGEGKIINIVSREYPLYFPKEGYSEQNPEDWLRETKTGIKELIKGIDSKDVKGLGIAGQMHGLVILDKDDKVLRPAILWNDGRTGVETKYLNEEIGRDKLSKYTNNIAFTGFTAPKILWVKNNEKEIFDKINKIMLPKDYITYMLTGIHATDYSDASGMLLLDVKNKKWSKEMCDICFIKEEMLPKLYESFDVVGSIKEEVAVELGLTNDVKVVAGAGDNAGAAIGTGTSEDGRCNISLGTSGTIFMSTDKSLLDKNNALHSFCHSNGKYHLMGCMLSAASCNMWWLSDIIGTKDYDKEVSEISDKDLGENNVFFLPYLMGERSPHNNEKARAVFFGMSMDTKRKDMTQAVYEGVAFALRDQLDIARKEGLVVKRSTICGGGSKSELWCKIIANTLNIELDILETNEGPSLGAAMLASVGCKEYNNVDDCIKKIVKAVKTIKPEKDLVDKYDKKYNKFKAIYPALKEIYNM